ncbi:efflux RND transporter periplasmic adaptor subunit [Rhodanobacter denitrificans]|uniref:Efflux RND transporter periplasmic adaptor subunit n=1 Tax=Rhodanobacter denitrificans TaxID=666685 RepID=A0A368KCV9_9GAMM|nr:efflux RND transporter periplasmic adaptor subunit [Rhodanobacter denitrificans]RCS29752.1 efflux RND transporter periplasmic adaptor subunit [Rhodanobacter denitrificans]
MDVGNAELLKELRIERHQREDHGSHPGRWPWIAAAVAVLLLLLGGGAWLFFGHRPVIVQTATAVAPSAGSEAGAVLQATGYVTARRRATVSAQITGTLTAVLIEEGDHVTRGQVLARLDDSGYKAGLAAARSQADAAHAQAAQIQVQLAQGIHDAARLESLVARGLVSKQAAEQARTQVDSLRAQLDAQRQQARSADAQAAVAQVNFDYCVVRAPFSGVVTTKDAQVGEIISPLSAGGGFTRTGVGTIVDMHSLEIDVDVNEAYIGRIKPGMPAETVLDAYPDWKIPAHVVAIVPTADRGKATIKVRVALEKKDARVVPDMGARVSFLEEKPKGVVSVPQGVLVPAAAIVQRDGRSVVFVLDGSQARQRVVNPAAQAYGELRLLPAAVKPGDSVVVSPPPELKDGSDVQTKKP